MKVKHNLRRLSQRVCIILYLLTQLPVYMYQLACMYKPRCKSAIHAEAIYVVSCLLYSSLHAKYVYSLLPGVCTHTGIESYILQSYIELEVEIFSLLAELS